MHTWIHADREWLLKGCNGFGGSATEAAQYNDHTCTPLFPWAINFAGATGIPAGNVDPMNGWEKLAVGLGSAFNQYNEAYDQFKVAFVRYTVHIASTRNTNNGGMATGTTEWTDNYSDKVKFMTLRDFDAWESRWMNNQPSSTVPKLVGTGASEEWTERGLRHNKKGQTRYGRQISARPKAMRNAPSEYQGLIQNEPETGTEWLAVDNARPTYGWFNCNPSGPASAANPAYILWYTPQIYSTPFLIAILGQDYSDVTKLGSIKLKLSASVCLCFRGRAEPNWTVEDQFSWA